MRRRNLAPNLYVLEGAVSTGVLVHEGKALLFDCCDSVTPARLKSAGAIFATMICCTQHRRPNVSGAYAFVENGAARIWIGVPDDAASGRYVVPFRVTWNGRYLGQFRHALVFVR